MSDLLKSMYSTYDILMGGRPPMEPSIKRLINWEDGCKLIKENFERDGIFLLHSDVDVDGVFSTEVALKWLRCLTSKDRVGVCINKEKIHGISERHVEYFSNVVGSNGLVIILDSSTNAIEYIKQMRCNVLVVDHHDVLVPESELKGNTQTGKYVVVTNMIGEEAEPTMSGALVLYELLRMYQYRYLAYVDYLMAMKLYQYVGVTLFTDEIPLDTERNQWYVNKTINAKDMEPDLLKLIENINPYQHSLDKSFISFNLAPMINRGIREGLSPNVLDIVVYAPNRISELAYLKEKHDLIKKDASIGVFEYDKFCLKDITNSGVSPSFCGLLASKVMEEKGKTTCCYKVLDNGIAKGSFRGMERLDYRALIASLDYCKAEGHPNAFGFEIPVDYIANVINYVVSMEQKAYKPPFMTIGSVFSNKVGLCHYNDLEQPKREQLIYKLAMINSRMLSKDSLYIVGANVPDKVKLTGMDGKVYNYNVYGLDCRAFEPIATQYVQIYIEFRKGIECFARPLVTY